MMKNDRQHSAFPAAFPDIFSFLLNNRQSPSVADCAMNQLLDHRVGIGL